MTKKELQTLHSNKCVIEKLTEVQLGRGPEIRYIVTFSLDAAELDALNQSLMYASSPTASTIRHSILSFINDVAAFFRNALSRVNIKL